MLLTVGLTLALLSAGCTSGGPAATSTQATSSDAPVDTNDSDRIRELEHEIGALRDQLAEAEQQRDQARLDARSAKSEAGVLGKLIADLEAEVLRLGLRYEPRTYAYQRHEGCGTGSLPDDWQERSIKVGPLWLWFMGHNPAGDGYDLSTKTLAILEPGRVVTPVVVEGWRDRVAHLYDPSTWNQGGRYRVENGRPAVTFRSCAQSLADFPGGFVYTPDARCAPFDIYTDATVPGERIVLTLDGDPCPDAESADTALRAEDAEHHVVVTYPADGYIADETWTPHLADPRVLVRQAGWA